MASSTYTRVWIVVFATFVFFLIFHLKDKKCLETILSETFISNIKLIDELNEKRHKRVQMNEVKKIFYWKISNISYLVTYYMVDKEVLLAIINQALICRITIGLPSVLYQTSRVISANAMFFILFFSDVVFVRYDFLHNLQDYFLSSIHFYQTEDVERNILI